jgi:prophage maintenance system killer protein
VVTVELFPALNRWRLGAPDTDAVPVMLAVAAGSTDETGFAEWIRRHAIK